MVFLQTACDEVELYEFDTAASSLTRRGASGIQYRSPNQAMLDHPRRLPAYPLISLIGRSGDGNSWNNFRCSGCFRPLQASRWHLLENLGGFGGSGTPMSRMRVPENSLGRFTGQRGTEMDDAGLRPHRPRIEIMPHGLGDGECWLGDSCTDLHADYRIPRERFFWGDTRDGTPRAQLERHLLCCEHLPGT